MSAESTIDKQIAIYEQLYTQHQTTRREDQGILIEPLQRFIDDVLNTLMEDKDAYEKARETHHQEFNLLKRVFTHTASEHETQFVLPLKLVYQRRKDLAEKARELLNETTVEVATVETRSRWNGSIAVVYNPITGRAEWKQYWHGGIHGVFNPLTNSIEWQEAYNSGIYGVFNPNLNTVEWRKKYNGGIHGVYNPSTGTVEWKTSFHAGINGVYNPLKKEIEWKTCFHGGVVGYYDYETQTVKWIENWHHGIGLIYWDPNAKTYLTTASSGWYDNE